jgi:hypothetical protein
LQFKIKKNEIIEKFYAGLFETKAELGRGSFATTDIIIR